MDKVLNVVLGFIVYTIQVFTAVLLFLTSLKLFGLEVDVFNFDYYLGGLSLSLAILVLLIILNMFIKSILKNW